MSGITGIHPIDGDLRFLKRLIRQLYQELGHEFRYLRLSNNVVSHSRCIQSLRSAPGETNVFFFCHGRSNGLIGCRFMDSYSTHHRRYVHREEVNDGNLFLYRSNIECLRGKKVFCLACDSNDFAREAISVGVRVFVGFGKVDFDKRELIETERYNRHVVDMTKYNLRKCLFASIIWAWENNVSYEKLVARFKLLINKVNDDLIMDRNKPWRHNYHVRAANNLQIIKEGIKIWGDGGLRLHD